MIPPPELIVALAIITFLYCAGKTLADFKARRWTWAAVGLIVTICAPTVVWAGASVLGDWLAAIGAR